VSLEDLVHRVRLPPGLTVPLLRALASALGAAHAVHVLHRDVKPGNVLLGRDGAIRLTDFGIASFVSAQMGRTLFGTPGYMPPEALRGKGFDQSGDLFALGAVAYRCLTGRSAFSGRTTSDVLMNTLKGRVTPLRELAPDVPEELARIVSSLLEPDPKKRTADAAQLARDLARVSAGRGWRWSLPDLSKTAKSGAAAPVSEAPHAQLVDTIDSGDVLKG
jgi:serine/threonine-protein kinase